MSRKKLFCGCNDQWVRSVLLSDLKIKEDYNFPTPTRRCKKCQMYKWFYIRKEDELNGGDRSTISTT